MAALCASSGVELGAEATSRSAKSLGFMRLFYADCTMMCSDDGAIDHVGGNVSIDHYASVSSIASNTPVDTRRFFPHSRRSASWPRFQFQASP
jgi:hypothetical protein